MVLIEQTALIDYLENHQDLALGHCSRTKEGRSLSKRYWMECAQILNSVSVDCPNKTRAEWRTVSMDMNQYSEDFRDIAVQFLQNTDQYSSIVDDLLRAVLKAVNKELTLVDRREILYYLLKSDIHKPERATNSPTNIYH